MKFNSIIDFVEFRKECIFCKDQLRVILTKFTDLTSTTIPAIKAPLINGKFEFNVNHTTPNFSIKADAVIDIEKNTIVFSNYTDGECPTIDAYVAKHTFEDFYTYIELYCSNKKCGLDYHMWGQFLKLVPLPSEPNVVDTWLIKPFGIMMEGVRVKNYVVHNDWNKMITNIYSRDNVDAKPIQVPFVDFSTMNKNKLITRIKTLVTFS